jgi:hypothetical protein
MNQSYQLPAMRMENPVVIQKGSFDAVKGLLWGSLLGGALWAAALAIAFNG